MRRGPGDMSPEPQLCQCGLQAAHRVQCHRAVVSTIQVEVINTEPQLNRMILWKLEFTSTFGIDLIGLMHAMS